MAHMTLRDIDSVRETIAKREINLPGYWGEPSDGTRLFNFACENAASLIHSHPEAQATKTACAIAQRFVRLTKQVLEDAKKKPKQAFELYNVTAIAFVHALDELELGVEEAFQWAQKKASPLIQAAKKDSSHWLRNTATWKKFLAKS